MSWPGPVFGMVPLTATAGVVVVVAGTVLVVVTGGTPVAVVDTNDAATVGLHENATGFGRPMLTLTLAPEKPKSILPVYAVQVRFFVLIVTPARPLWPAQTWLRKALEVSPDNRLLTRALATYSVYSIRSDPLPDFRAALPRDLKVVGFLGGPDDLDISLWRPYGGRRVEAIARQATAEQIRLRKLQYAVVSGLFLEFYNISFDDWLSRSRAEVVASATVTTAVSAGPQRWYVVRFKD